jgi:hypothetical protein
MTDAELAVEVRTELGKLETSNIVDITDPDISREAGHILGRINSRITKKVLRSFTTTQNVREYAVNDATLRVQELLAGDEVEELKMKLGSYIVGEEVENDDIYNFPSLWYINASRRKRALPNIRWEWNPVEKKLKMDPTPSATGDTWWYVSVESAGWTLAACPIDFKELVIRGTVWKCLEIVALRRSTEGGIERGGGRVDYPADALNRIAQTVKEDFYEELDYKVKLYSL